MIEKIRTTEQGLYNEHGTFLGTMPKDTDSLTLANKINELVDAVNKHEDIIRQIGEWGTSKGECLWCENLTAVNLDGRMIGCTTLDIPESYKTDPYAEQRNYDVYVKNRHLIGKLCKFKFGAGYTYGILTNIKRKPSQWAFESNGRAFSSCEPVKPTDLIIYKGGDNE